MEVPSVVRKGWPVVIEVSQTLPARPDVVWGLITDWENLSDWQLEARDFTVVSPHRQGVGVEAEATVKIGGISTRDRVRIAGWDPPRRLEIEHLGWVSGTGEMHLTPLGTDRTHLFWREELYPPIGMLGALGMSAFKPLMKRIFRRDLKVLASLARTVARAGAKPKA